MIVDWFVYDTISLSRSSPLGAALDFFVYDTAKIFFLLVFLIFAISLLRSFFPPRKPNAYSRRPRYPSAISSPPFSAS
jgi:uncharacterized protein